MNKEKCAVKGCVRLVRVHKHQLCHTHVQRLYRTGQPGAARINVKRLREPYRAVIK